MPNLTAPTRSTSTKIDPRYENFIQAYLEIGCSDDEAQERGFDRFQEDKDARFTLHACTNFSTAKETVWLLEAASMLCCGSLHNASAVELIQKALKGLSK